MFSEGWSRLKSVQSYDYNGKILYDFPANLKVLGACKPVYETIPGWNEDISGVRKFNELPQNTRNYLRRIESLLEVPVDIVSVGPGRKETIILHNPFA